MNLTKEQKREIKEFFNNITYYGIEEDIKGTALSFLDDFLLDELTSIR